MPVSTLRTRVSSALTSFAWDEWAQMGVLATPRRESPWACDPEAHLLFTLQVARSDPRLFEEVLDWTATNFTLLSAQRLRNMEASPDDQPLVDGALAWLSANGDRVRAFAPRRTPAAAGEPELLFYRQRTPTRIDETFLSAGFIKPATTRSRKSKRPDPRLPINFPYLLRSVFGVGSRAEVMRFLLTGTASAPGGQRPRFTTSAIAESAGFAKRNVQDTLNALVQAQAVELVTRGKEHLYRVDLDAWRRPLHLEDGVPQYRDWTHALLGFRELHRWLWRPELEELTLYMLSSEARRKMGELASSFEYAGFSVHDPPVDGEAYWDVFVEAVERLLGELESPLPL